MVYTAAQGPKTTLSKEDKTKTKTKPKATIDFKCASATTNILLSKSRNKVFSIDVTNF